MLTGAELARFLFAITALLGAAHALGALFETLRMPRVIGEIGGGLLLGPTLLGWAAPALNAWLFAAFPGEGQLIGALSGIGLALLMFISGFEMQRSLDRGERRLVVAILCGATFTSLLAGWWLYAAFDFSRYFGPSRNELAFRLILAIAIAVTSIPVISRIFIDLGMMRSWFAKVVLAAATAEDIILWVVLAVATGLAESGVVSFAAIASHVATTLAFFAITLFGMRPVLRALLHSPLSACVTAAPSAFALIICFLLAAVASVLEVNLVFGAFVAGLALGRMPEAQFEPVKRHIKEFSLAFFVPIYFAVVGLKLDLVHHFDLLPFLGFLIFATAVKAVATALSARMAGQDWRSSLNFGAAMNARGGPGIVVASIAFDLQIIDATFFSILVMTALVTSLGAGYWLRIVTTHHPALLNLKDIRT